ncbi:MAG: hypothetical protein ACK53F_00760 [Betaproteobacteria bacterium]
MGARSKAGEWASNFSPDRSQHREPCLRNAYGKEAPNWLIHRPSAEYFDAAGAL